MKKFRWDVYRMKCESFGELEYLFTTEPLHAKEIAIQCEDNGRVFKRSKIQIES